MKTARNIAIIALIAAAVKYLPGGGRAATTFVAIIEVAFAVGLAFIARLLYREHHTAIYGLGDQRRALLYGGLAVGMVALTARLRMWETGFGEFVWFVLIGLVIYTLVALYRYSRTY